MPSPGLEARLQRARYALERLRRAARTPWEDYIANRDLQDIVERNLHILLESILDLAAYIASRRGLVCEASYKGLMKALVENNNYTQGDVWPSTLSSRYEEHTGPRLR